jgi:hypothetical protein
MARPSPPNPKGTAFCRASGCFRPLSPEQADHPETARNAVLRVFAAFPVFR